MYRLASGKIEIEGPGVTQARSRLQRIFILDVTHSPVREDCAVKPEAVQNKTTTITCQLMRPRGHRDCDLACGKEVE